MWRERAAAWCPTAVVFITYSWSQKTKEENETTQLRRFTSPASDKGKTTKFERSEQLVREVQPEDISWSPVTIPVAHFFRPAFFMAPALSQHDLLQVLFRTQSSFHAVLAIAMERDSHHGTHVFMFFAVRCGQSMFVNCQRT